MNYDKLTKEQLLGIHKDTLEYLNEQEQEIERLNNIINKAIEYIQGEIEDNYFKRYDDEVYKMCDDLIDILKGSDKDED